MSDEFKCHNNVYVLLLEALNGMIRLSLFSNGSYCSIDLLCFTGPVPAAAPTDQTCGKRRDDFEAVVMAEGEADKNMP